MKDVDEIEVQILKIIEEIDKGLLLLGIIKKSEAVHMTQLKYKSLILYEEYYKYKSFIKLKESLEPSGYKEYPYKLLDNNGYIILYSENFSPAISEHRYVMQIEIGRKLLRDEFVHHIDKNKTNNTVDNLLIVSPLEHRKIHRVKIND